MWPAVYTRAAAAAAAAYPHVFKYGFQTLTQVSVIYLVLTKQNRFGSADDLVDSG